MATATNAAIYKHHYCGGKCCCAGLPMAVTLGLCFCPVLYVGCTMKRNVNAEIAKLPEVQQLQDRGITLEWILDGDLGGTGGMYITSTRAPPIQTTMERHT